MKQAALAGNALSITGVTPLYKANGPSVLISSRKTSRIPFLYVPCGADNNIDVDYGGKLLRKFIKSNP